MMKNQIQIGNFGYLVGVANTTYKLGRWVAEEQKLDSRGIPIMATKFAQRKSNAMFYFRGFPFYINLPYFENGKTKVFVTCPITGSSVLSTEETNIEKIYDLAVGRLRENWGKYIEIISNTGVNVQNNPIINIL